MKFTKFIPVVLALALTVPAYAATSDHADSVLNLTVDRFVNVTTSTPALNTNTTVDDQYSTLTLTNPFSVAFNVITNDPAQKLTLSAKTTASDGDTEALFKNGEELGIVFANTTANQLPTKSQVANITAGSTPTKEGNPNAVAFLFNTKSITPKSAADGGGSVTSTTVNQNNVVYAVTNGVYDFSYITNAANFTNTFSPHDTHGTYEATLTLTSTTTP